MDNVNSKVIVMNEYSIKSSPLIIISLFIIICSLYFVFIFKYDNYELSGGVVVFKDNRYYLKVPVIKDEVINFPNYNMIIDNVSYNIKVKEVEENIFYNYNYEEMQSVLIDLEKSNNIYENMFLKIYIVKGKTTIYKKYVKERL